MRTQIAFLILIIGLFAGCQDEQPTQVQQSNDPLIINTDSIKIASIEVSDLDVIYRLSQDTTADTVTRQISFSDSVGVCGDKVRVTKHNDTISILCNLNYGNSYYNETFNFREIVIVVHQNSVQSLRYYSKSGHHQRSGGQANYTVSDESAENLLQLISPKFKTENGELIFDVSGKELGQYLAKVDYSTSSLSGQYGTPFGNFVSSSSAGVIGIRPPSDIARIRIALKP